MRRPLVALAAGILVALMLSGLPATAADAPIAAQPDSTWKPKDVTIAPGDSVTWSNPSSGFHNVCVAKAGADATSCSDANHEFRNGAPATSWAAYTNSHTFGTAGTYKFQC